MHVVYLEPVPPEVEAIIRECLPAGFTLRVRRADESPVDVVGEADFILVATTPLTAHVISAAPRLKLIQHQGVGYDNVDVAAASQAGIPVGLTPEGTTKPVAEFVFLLILSLYRKLCVANQAMRQGQWLQWQLRPQSYNLMGKRLGIVGLGRIGREVARRAKAFECHLAYYDVVRAPVGVEAELGIDYVPLDELLASSDIITLHVPRTGQTRGMIGAPQLARMKPTALLINTARGGLVDEGALYQALTKGQIAGAGLDVFALEPPGADNPLLHLDQVVATPHIAAGTRDALADKMRAAFANMQRVAEGQPPVNQVPYIQSPNKYKENPA
ncbi:MAG: 2-hydroxyacid dehydrogenase [Anaerolineae bacterium]